MYAVTVNSLGPSLLLAHRLAAWMQCYGAYAIVYISLGAPVLFAHRRLAHIQWCKAYAVADIKVGAPLSSAHWLAALDSMFGSACKHIFTKVPLYCQPIDTRPAFNYINPMQWQVLGYAPLYC